MFSSFVLMQASPAHILLEELSVWVTCLHKFDRKWSTDRQSRLSLFLLLVVSVLTNINTHEYFVYLFYTHYSLVVRFLLIIKMNLWYLFTFVSLSQVSEVYPDNYECERTAWIWRVRLQVIFKNILNTFILNCIITNYDVMWGFKPVKKEEIRVSARCRTIGWMQN